MAVMLRIVQRVDVLKNAAISGVGVTRRRSRAAARYAVRDVTASALRGRELESTTNPRRAIAASLLVEHLGDFGRKYGVVD